MVKEARLQIKLLEAHICGIQAVVAIMFKPTYFSRLPLEGVVTIVASWDALPWILVGASSFGSRVSRVLEVFLSQAGRGRGRRGHMYALGGRPEVKASNVVITSTIFISHQTAYVLFDPGFT